LESKAGYIKLLKDRGLKATKNRLKVLSLIDVYKNAIPQSKLQVQLEDFDRVTLYRTLNTLSKNGIIHKAATTESDVYYAICNPDTCDVGKHQHEQHVHFKCKQCKEVSCLETKDDLTISIGNYKLDSIEITATGLCENCRA